MNNNYSTTAAVGDASKKFAPTGKVSDKDGGEAKSKRTYGGRRGLGLMNRPNGGGPNIPRDFGRGGKHKFAGKFRRRSPMTKPMRLSRRLSYKIQRSTPIKSPITALTLNWTPNTMHGDLKQPHSAVECETKAPAAKEN